MREKPAPTRWAPYANVAIRTIEHDKKIACIYRLGGKSEATLETRTSRGLAIDVWLVEVPFDPDYDFVLHRRLEHEVRMNAILDQDCCRARTIFNLI